MIPVVLLLDQELLSLRHTPKSIQQDTGEPLLLAPFVNVCEAVFVLILIVFPYIYCFEFVVFPCGGQAYAKVSPEINGDLGVFSLKLCIFLDFFDVKIRLHAAKANHRKVALSGMAFAVSCLQLIYAVSKVGGVAGLHVGNLS